MFYNVSTMISPTSTSHQKWLLRCSDRGYQNFIGAMSDVIVDCRSSTSNPQSQLLISQCCVC